jgi:gamma-glutamyltranspeptidase/glutathione hydrolase
VEAVKSAGGNMTPQDLAGYQVKEREPLTRTIDGRTIHTMPAPSAGGLMLLETLVMFGASSSSPLNAMGFGSSAYLHTVAEAMRGAVADRARMASDPDLETSVMLKYEAALDAKRLADRKSKIDPNKTHPPIDFITREKGTTHLIVADGEGNVVSLTTTINTAFGAGIVVEGAGILLNDQLSDFTSPEEAKRYNLATSPNRPRARGRPVSSMTPTIVLENGEPILAVGGSGGPRIATGVTQATLARLVFDLDPVACVSHPRVHVQGANLLADKEIPVDVRRALEAKGETVKDESFQESAMLMLAWKRGPAGTHVLGAADPRKAGFAAAR